MNKRQVIQHAKNYLDLLAAGTDPISNEKIEGITAVAEYLREEGKELARNFAFPRIQWVESDEGE